MRTLKFEGVPEIDDALRKQLTEYGVGGASCCQSADTHSNSD